MRVACLNADYPAFLDQLYGADPDLATSSYEQQMARRNASLFSTADFYSSHLTAAGHPAIDVHINNEPLQRAWAMEHGFGADRVGGASAPTGRRADAVRSILDRPVLRRLRPMVRRVARRVHRPWLVDVLGAQLDAHRPNVVLDQAVGAVELATLRRMAPDALLVAHVATTVEWSIVREYDLLVSSLPGMVEHAAASGMPAVLSRFAFEPRVLDAVGPAAPRFELTFAGSLAAAHGRRRALLGALGAALPLDVFTDGDVPDGVDPARVHRPVFGRDMYAVLRDSRATVNEHGDVLFGGRNTTARSANNIRLYEATGVGTALVTDAKDDLAEIFRPGEEVVTFTSPSDCIEVVRSLLADEDRRAAIAAAGQRRTLRDHTYERRVAELIVHLEQQVQPR